MRLPQSKPAMVDNPAVRAAFQSTPHVRVLYPVRYWTPVRREVFEDVCPQLKANRGALVYLVLYDQAWRSGDRRVSATVTDVTRWTGLDGRTIQKCLVKLESKGCVVSVRSGRVRSRTNKPVWRVPLAEFDFRKQGPWTPVPTFILYRYCQAYSKAVLLPVILWHQHIGWRDWCWPGAPRLATLMHWPVARVYAALRTMGRRDRWEKLGTGLPQPLEIQCRRSKKSGWTRHFHVRAVHYQQSSTQPSVRLDEEFAKFFHVPELRSGLSLGEHSAAK